MKESRRLRKLLPADQAAISQVASIHNPQQSIAEDVRVVAVVESPLQFFQIAVQVLDAHLVKRANNRTLEQRPHALDPVGVHVTDYPFLIGMAYRLVASVVASVVVSDSEVRLQLVCVDRLSLILHRASDEVMQRAPLDVRDALDTNLPAALDGTGHPSLVAFIGHALALGSATDQRFIHFDDPEQRRPFKRIVAHRFADTVAEIPSGLVGDPEGAVELIGRHALAGLAHQVDRCEPLSQRQVRIVHNRSRRRAELVAAAQAVKLSAALNEGNICVATADAAHAVRPSQFLQQLLTLVIAAKAVQQGYDVHGSDPQEKAKARAK